MNSKKTKENFNKIFLNIKDDYLLVTFFIVLNLINSIIIRLVTVKNGLSISPLLVDLSFLIIISLISLLFKRKKRIKYFITVSVILNIICIINSIYYHYYSSFASISLLATAVFAADVSDAIVENVLKPIDLIYIWQSIALYIFYRYLKKKNYFKYEIKQ